MRNKIPRWVLRLIPDYTVLPLLCALLLQTIAFQGTKLLLVGVHHYNFETAWDLAIPFLPWTVLIYVGTFVYWAAAIVLILRSGKENAFRFLWAHMISMVIAMVIFLLMPTTNTRPQVTGGGIWNLGMRVVYAVDTPENLFPSLHCQLSWLCCLALWKAPGVSRGLKWFCTVFSLLVFVSTLTTKQHILMDVFGGWLLAEATFRLCGSKIITRPFYRVFDR